MGGTCRNSAPQVVFAVSAGRAVPGIALSSPQASSCICTLMLWCFILTTVTLLLLLKALNSAVCLLW